MNLKQDLQIGETPWDDLDRVDLLWHVRRMYSALNSAKCALAISSHDERFGYWSRQGTGGGALAKCKIALNGLEDDGYREEVYRAFFRYADDLLFAPDLGFRWMVCETCNQMFGPGGDSQPLPDKCCDPKCGSPMRPIKWSDIGPRS